MNSKLKTLNLRAASLLAALSLNLTAYASLAESSATTASSSAAGTQAGSAAKATPASAASSAASQTGATTATTAVSGATTAKVSTMPGGRAQPAVVAKTSDLVALQGPTLITQKGAGWKTASTFIDLKDGQQALPLTFSVTNGANNQAKMQGVRMKLNGHEILTEKAFKDKDTVSVNLTGILSSGQTQLITETYGHDGAGLSWVLTTYKIKVSDIKPVNCKIGETVKISGKNFPTDKSAFKLTVDQTAATITKATATGVDFVVPQVPGGKRTVTLYIAGVKCDPLYIKVAAAPEVTSLNLLGIAPGGTFTVQGKGFSTTAGENTVLFKSPDGSSTIGQAAPTAATETELTVTLPMDIPCPSDVLCTVKTNGQESPKGVLFGCSQRVIDKGFVQ